MKKANEPAFPQEEDASYAFSGKVTSPGVMKGGLTKREYFAAMAMQGMLADEAWLDGVNAVAKEGLKNAEQLLACSSVRFADALLAELSKAKP